MLVIMHVRLSGIVLTVIKKIIIITVYYLCTVCRCLLLQTEQQCLLYTTIFDSQPFHSRANSLPGTNRSLALYLVHFLTCI